MGKYEVTQGEYNEMMGSNPSYFSGDSSRPVEQVSWNDALAYCAALTTREGNAGRLPAGYVYRLPTEAEWEYACRGGPATPFYQGDEFRSGMADFYGNFEYLAGEPYHHNPGGIYLGRTTMIGSYGPNPWGLCDMEGNVREWCLDWYGPYPSGNVTDPQGPPTGAYRVIRGGSWTSLAVDCRSADRDYDFAGFKNDSIGFRVVLAPSLP